MILAAGAARLAWYCKRGRLSATGTWQSRTQNKERIGRYESKNLF